MRENKIAYAIKHKDEDIRAKSRSGGVFTALSDKALDKGGVIYGCAQGDNIEAVKYAERLAREKGLKLCLYAPKIKCSSDYIDCICDGPSEFLYRLKNAKYVVTTSFHCVVFSVMFCRPFLAFVRGASSIKIPSLLKELEISDRIAVGSDEADIDAAQIDFERANARLKEMGADSWSYIRNALSGL